MAKKSIVKDANVVDEKELEIQKELEDLDEEKAVEEIKVKDTAKKKIKKEKKEAKRKAKEEKKANKSTVFTEMKKVVWPEGKSVLKYTIAVVVFCLFLALFFAAVTALIVLVVEK